MTRSEIERFYLTNHDFNVIVNKANQAYGKSKDETLQDAIIQEICKEMQKGGCNEERKHHDGTDPDCTSEAGSIAANCS